ncbi:MAG TPA: glycosyltransferase family 39 protein [Abditibacterium sp.]|jgi:4-amino-4-deoxy-L-arabinose transferase-like glycosyltransferase
MMMSRFLSWRHAPIVSLILLCSLTLFFGLGRISLVGSDEPRYAEIARAMWATGDYVSPRLAGRLWLEKPPLLYWGQAFCYSVFGVNELAARLPSALGALFIVLMLYGTASRALGPRVALYVGVVAATMAMIVVPAHGATTDMPLCAMFAGAFLCLFRASISQKHALKWNLASAAFVGGAMLAKGLIGPLFFVLISGIWWLWARPDRAEFRPYAPRPLSSRLATFLAATATFLAVSAIWYAPVWLRHGEVFWKEFFLNHHFKRFTSNTYKHWQPFYFYLSILPICALPWTPWLVSALFGLRGLRPRTGARDSFLALAWVWAAIPIAFFSSSEAKLEFYILPSFPAIAILIGDSLARGALLPRAWKPKWVAVGGSALMIFVVLFLFLIYAPPRQDKLSTRALCLQVAAQMKPGERATFLGLIKEYTPVFYLQGRVVPGVGAIGSGGHDTFVANTPAQLVPLLQNGSLIVFCKDDERALLEKNPAFSAQFLGSQRGVSAFRLQILN